MPDRNDDDSEVTPGSEPGRPPETNGNGTLEDTPVVTMAELRREFGRLKANVGGVGANLTEVRAEVAGFGTKVTEFAAVMAEARTDLTELRSEVGELKAEMTDVKAGLGDFKGDFSALVTELRSVTAGLDELRRLRVHDSDLVDRLHAENTTLRAGEYAKALAPLVSGLLRLQDQMGLLAGDDKTSDAAMLRTQLLQVLDTAAGITAFTPEPGERFSADRHVGSLRVSTEDPEAKGTIARCLRPGFQRLDGSVIRVAEVEVFHYSPPPDGVGGEVSEPGIPDNTGFESEDTEDIEEQEDDGGNRGE